MSPIPETPFRTAVELFARGTATLPRGYRHVGETPVVLVAAPVPHVVAVLRWLRDWWIWGGGWRRGDRGCCAGAVKAWGPGPPAPVFDAGVPRRVGGWVLRAGTSNARHSGRVVKGKTRL